MLWCYALPNGLILSANTLNISEAPAAVAALGGP
jgi:hypothetical protein